MTPLERLPQLVAVAMSGGVDSSVTAALLQQQGHRVIGVTMQLCGPDGGPGTPVHDAAAVAARLGIPHHVVDLRSEFQRLIISDFIGEYRRGRTPNPCIACNRFIKFGLLLSAAADLGADFLATGHYAAVTRDADGTCHLRPARNRSKDQSYFLYTLSQERLARVLFPLGEIESKEEVRRLAREFDLPVADKGDSQEVCFIPHDDYAAFLETHGASAPAGTIVHCSGAVLGRHRGIHRYTIGQRRGLGIAWREPLYVVGIDAAENRVVVGEAALVESEGLYAEQINWIVAPRQEELTASCKIRYRHQPVECRISILPEGRCLVRFEAPQKAVTPGQAVVFYQGGEVLGGATISAPLRSNRAHETA